MRYITTVILLCILSLSGCGSMKHDNRVHKVFIYEKSNLDGSNKGKIAVYYAGPDELASFKWHEGNHHATLVKAQMDLKTNTVKLFEAFGADHEGNENLRATLEVQEDRTANIRFGDQQDVFENVPEKWHSYDFDFASLGHAFHAIRKNQSNTFHILDVDPTGSGPEFKDFGLVEMEFLGEEEKWSRTLLKYSIDGEGLDNRGGYIWFDKEGSYLVAFEIEKPDERGYDSNKLVLKEVLDLTPTQWSDFKIEKLN